MKFSKRPTREDIGLNEVLCSHCEAKCCRYFALSIENPTTWKQFDEIRWFLMHEFATAFVEGKDWYLLVHTPCRHLRSDNTCGIYEKRPNICRSYSTKKCEYDDLWVYDQYFELPEQIEEYAEAVLGSHLNFSC